MTLGAVLNEIVLGGAALGAVVYIGRQFGRLVVKLDGIADAPADVRELQVKVAQNTETIEKLTRQMGKLTQQMAKLARIVEERARSPL